MAVSEFPEWVDGKAFAGWIEGRRPDLRQVISESQSRALHRLRTEGGRAALDTVDGLCCALGLHINEIPEWAWIADPLTRRRVYDQDVKMEASALLIDGASCTQVAETLDVPLGTIKRWRRELGKRLADG